MCFFFLVNLFKFQLGSAFFFNITFYLIYEHRKKKKKLIDLSMNLLQLISYIIVLY